MTCKMYELVKVSQKIFVSIFIEIVSIIKCFFLNLSELKKDNKTSWQDGKKDC